MKKIIYLIISMILTGILSSCQKTPDTVTPEFVLTYADNQPENYPTVKGAKKFAQLVSKHTEGKVVIQVKSGGQYGTEQEILDQMAFGGIDFARVSISSVSDTLPKLNVLQLPFLYDDAAHMRQVLDGDIGEEFLHSFSEIGLVGLSWYEAGARSFYSSSTPILGPEHLRGKVIRVQESQMMKDMVRLLGGRAASYDYNDIYYAFDTGKIDVAENNWPSYQQQEHYKIAPYYTVNEHTRVPDVQLASQRTWDVLPEQYQKIIYQCARESAQYQRMLWNRQEVDSRKIALENGCHEISISETALIEFRKLVKPLYDLYCEDYMYLVRTIQNLNVQENEK